MKALHSIQLSRLLTKCFLLQVVLPYPVWSNEINAQLWWHWRHQRICQLAAVSFAGWLCHTGSVVSWPRWVLQLNQTHRRCTCKRLQHLTQAMYIPASSWDLASCWCATLTYSQTIATVQCLWFGQADKHRRMHFLDISNKDQIGQRITEISSIPHTWTSNDMHSCIADNESESGVSRHQIFYQTWWTARIFRALTLQLLPLPLVRKILQPTSNIGRCFTFGHTSADAKHSAAADAPAF